MLALGVSRAASLTFTHSPKPTSLPFETALLVFLFLVGSLRREEGCPIDNVGHDGREKDGFPPLPMAGEASATDRGDDGRREMGRRAKERGMLDDHRRA